MVLPDTDYQRISKVFDDLFEKNFPQPEMTEGERSAFRKEWLAYLKTQKISDEDFVETLEYWIRLNFVPNVEKA